MGIGHSLKLAMQKNNTNANELASRLGVTPSTLYSMVQRDSNRINIDLVAKIAHVLNMTLDELLFGNDSSTSKAYLSSFEQDLVNAYRRAPESRKEAVRALFEIEDQEKESAGGLAESSAS